MQSMLQLPHQSTYNNISNMKSQTSMVYKTDNLPMTKVILESMVNNLGDKIRKMTLDLTFKNQQNKSAFVSSLQKNKQRRKAPIELIQPSDIEQSYDQNEGFTTEVQSKSGVNQKQSEDVYIIEETFERSILLRERFMDKLHQIGKRLHVTFRVVPKKVKIIGPNRNLVDEAQDEYRDIQEDICFQPIDNFGREIYESSYYSQLLKENNVQIIPILKRYYFWFLKSKTNPKQILQQIFTNMFHCFYPLRFKNVTVVNSIYKRQPQRNGIVSGKGTVVLGSIKFTNTGEKITDSLFVRTKARIFEEGIKLKLINSQDFQQKHLQLSIDKTNLILHMNAQQQQQIQKKSIQQQFAKYTFVYLVFSSEKSNEIEMVFKKIKFSDSFKKNKQNDIKDSHVLWEINEGFVCLAFLDHKQLTIEERIQKHPLFRIINSLPYQLLQFSIGVFDHISLPQTDQFKFTTIERHPQEKITLIGLKNMVKSNYEKLARLFIENKLSSQYWVREKEIQSMLNSRTEQINVSMDLTKVVNESSHMIINDISMEYQENRNNQGDDKGNKILSNIEAECYKFRYQQYNIVVKQSQAENKKKYEKAVDKVEKAKLPFNFQEYCKIMYNATTFKYKTNRVNIPKDHMTNLSEQAQKLLSIKPELAQHNRQIIVFCGGKECKQLPPGFYEKDNKIKITKIEKNYSIKQGFLLLTNAMFLFQEQADQLPYGRYEALCFLKKID